MPQIKLIPNLLYLVHRLDSLLFSPVSSQRNQPAGLFPNATVVSKHKSPRVSPTMECSSYKVQRVVGHPS